MASEKPTQDPVSDSYNTKEFPTSNPTRQCGEHGRNPVQHQRGPTTGNPERRPRRVDNF